MYDFGKEQETQPYFNNQIKRQTVINHVTVWNDSLPTIYVN